MKPKLRQSPEEVIEFWFNERTRKNWWKKDATFDEEIRRRFLALHRRARAGALSSWRATPAGRLAEIIVLDQFSRNMFRDSARAYSQDTQARALTREAVACGADRALPVEQRAFLYMPLMHSESAADHDEAVRLYSSHPGLEYNLKFEMKHKAIIDRFGRYPHRNQDLKRASTAEEIRFLQQPGSSF